MLNFTLEAKTGSNRKRDMGKTMNKDDDERLNFSVFNFTSDVFFIYVNNLTEPFSKTKSKSSNSSGKYVKYESTESVNQS